MNFIDTHAHLYAKEFDGDRSEIIRLSKAAGVNTILVPNEDATSIEALYALCDQEPDYAYPMMGLHPSSIKEDYVLELKKIETALTKRPYYAIGETGMDLYWDKRFIKEQKIAFEEQLRWSIDLLLPVAIHSRKSLNEILDIIYKVGESRLKGVFHCFGGPTEQWKEISKLENFLVGIGGIVTFKNCRLAETLQLIPTERIVLETDAPYLAPVPFRGQRNEPAYLIETAKKVAELLQTTTEMIAKTTSANACRLFGISYLKG